MLVLESGVEAFAGGNTIVIFQLEDGVYELHRATPGRVDTLVVRPNLMNEDNVYQVAGFCAGLVDSWDIAE